MILDELVLHNVGVFTGQHRFDLTPPERRGKENGGTRPIVLFGGLNGSGKTTIRDALYLALYGPLAQGSTRRTGSYDDYLRSMISRSCSPQEGSAIELEFHAHREGRPQAYRVCRSWQVTGSGAVRERLVVLCDGQRSEALTATWAEQVEAFLPRGIAGLFFFDGEQIEAMADLERSREVLKSALAALLGLDLVDRLDTDLAVIRRRHRINTLPDELRGELEAAQAAHTSARQAIERQEAAVAAARLDLERTDKAHFEALERYRSAGGELIENREQIEQRLAALKADLARLDGELREAASGATPLLFVEKALVSLGARAQMEAGATRDRLLLDVLADRDRAALDVLVQARVRSAAVDSLRAFLEADRQSRARNAAVEPITGLVGPEGPEYLVRRVLPDSRRHLVQLLKGRTALVSEVEAAERLTTAIPDPEALLSLQEARDKAHTDLLRAEAAFAHASDQLSALRSEHERAESRFNRVLGSTTDAELTIDDNRRILEHVDRVRETLERFKVAATKRHVDRIAALVLESLQRLLRKDNLITDIGIDPGSLAVELRGSDGTVIAAEALSAGERQLLAVALLWGLAQASGQPLPVVIDTPLGRLDSAHRRRLLDRYFPHVSHQVLLLSTDTEIDAEAYEAIKRDVGHAYCLESMPDGTTNVRPGYFLFGATDAR